LLVAALKSRHRDPRGGGFLLPRNDMDQVDKDSLEYVLWCAKIHVVDLLAQLRDDGAIPVVELVERLTKLLGLLQETEAKAQGKPPGG
jgi:hypothetical protein